MTYVDLPGEADLFPILYGLARAAGWNPHNLHDLYSGACFLPWIGASTIQILHNILQRQVKN